MVKKSSSTSSVKSRSARRSRGGSFTRRFFRFLRSPLLLVPILLLAIGGAGVLTYYYFRFTKLIDAGLRGDIFVRSSGIYAAPPSLRPGAPARLETILTHLRRIGYVERGTTQNERRGQYALRGATLEVYPAAEAAIDGERVFRNLRLSFGRNGDGLQSITDPTSRETIEQASLEPEIISSVISQEREKRKIIDYKDLPQNLVDAIVAVEDRQFFEHSGINWRGIVRAAIRDYQLGELREGGSSITQQLVKNFYLTPEKSLKRKLAEAYISILLEQRLTKEQIMGMYCNQIYLGQRGGFSVNGFGEAARSYFDKDVSHLTLAESALLAGIIRSPNYYSPLTHGDRARDRRNMVLELMSDEGKVTSQEAEKAKAAPLGVKGKRGGLDVSDAPYFVDYLSRQLEREFDDRGAALRALRIYSTLDLELQRAAYQAVTRNMAGVEKMLARRKGGTAGLQAALVALNPKTGEILAMIGGRDYATSQLNRATDARRQPGSVFKPFVYATALAQSSDEHGAAYTPATMFLDAPRTFEYGYGKTYSPGNFGDAYDHRKITLRDALVHSKNVIAVALGEQVGFSPIARLAERAGLPKMPTYPSMALGVGEATPLQMASAYTTFPNLGRRVSPLAIKRVTSGTGVTLYKSSTETREVISPQVAYLMTSMMQDVLNRGTGARVRQMGLKGTVAGKTGSSRDGWFAGYTPNLVCVVWVGFDDNSDLKLTGSQSAAPIWADFMMRALQLRPDLGGEFEDPGNILTVDIDPTTGLLAQAGALQVRHELFIKGTEPTTSDQSAPEDEESILPSLTNPPPILPPAADSRVARATGLPSSGPAAGTISLDVCTATGLLPLAGVCPRTIRKSYTIENMPDRFCSESHHATRPRISNTARPHDR